jgi:glucose-1-phosphate thymidylyltransferase
MVSKAVLFAPAKAESAEHVPLLPVGNRPLVLHALDELRAAGIRDVAVVSETPVADGIEAALEGWATGPCTVEHTAVDTTRGFLDRLHGVAGFLGDDQFAVHLCDSLRHTCLASSLDETPVGENDVLALVASPDPATTPVGAGLASVSTAGIYVFGRGVHDIRQAEARTGPLDLQIADAIATLRAAGGDVELRAVEEFWRYGSRPDVLLQANRFFLSGLKPALTEAWLENTDLQGPVSIDPSARLRSATIRGPVIIGPGVQVSNAYIGPYSSIGRGAQIENAEVEHSIVLPGASIRNVGGRLEASVVGPGARVFRDFRLPRALRLNIGEGAEVAIT